MPNPTGSNGYGEQNGSGVFQEQPYGQIERLKNLTAAAPIGSPAAANAPRRAQRAAVKGRRAATPAQAVAGPPPTSPGLSYDQMNSGFWQTVLNTPGISPLVQQIAQQALGG